MHPVISAGNTAVITGGASGIGLAAALRFAGSGMKVVLADLGADRLAAAEAQMPGCRGGGCAGGRG